MTELESHHCATFHKTIDFGKDHQWMKPVRAFNLYRTIGGNPGLLGESGKTSVMITEKFTEQCLKST